MEAIDQWKQLSQDDVSTTAEVEDLATMLLGFGLRAMDALHVASAIYGACDYFLTTDKQILRKMANAANIKVLDPVDFIREVEAVD